MTRRSIVALSVGLALIATACHKNPPPGVIPTSSGTSIQSSDGSNRPAPPPPTAPPVNNRDPVPGGSFEENSRRMADRIHFDYNESTVRADDNARLDAKAVIMKQFPALPHPHHRSRR